LVVDVTPPASRNAPCPCGSGRHYKECHGAVGTGPAAVPGPLDRLPTRALADQQAGRLERAIAACDEALALVPGHFDATQMLGVAHFQRGDFERRSVQR